MRKLEIHVLKHDTDLVLERLGASRCFQLGAAFKKGAKAQTAYGASLQKLREMRDFLDLPVPAAMPDGVKLPDPSLDAMVDRMSGEVSELAAREGALETRRGQIRDAMGEAKAFEGLNLPFRELDHLSFLSVRVGRVPPHELETLSASLGERALIVPIDAEGGIVATSSKKGRFALDTELQRANFRPKDFPPDFEGIPTELLPSLEAELEALDRSETEIVKRKAELVAAFKAPWEALYTSYSVAEAIEEVKGRLESSDQVYRLEGWVPKERVGRLVSELRTGTEGRIAVRVYTPDELETVRSGEEKVPVLLKRRAFVSSFERLVVSYGAPLYGTIDPTPVVAFFFVLLFSIMFGDLGQGALILLAGLVIGRGRLASLAKYRKFGPIFVAAGLGSMVMGLLVGSVFSSEDLLVPLTRRLTAALLGRPLDRILTLMPSGGSMDKLFGFFGFTLGVGFLVNSIGLVINIANKWRLGKKGEALLGKTGLVGALFFWWAVGMGLRAVLGGRLGWIDGLGLGLPLAGIAFSDPLRRRQDGGGEAEGLFGGVVKGIVEVIESVSYYFSNTLSFLRVGAFALSHTVLSFIVFAMGDLVRLRAPVGIIWEILIVVIGNAVILVLEGMIVAIQVIRLQYYEFFSKFFTEIGVEFDPFVFEYPKESKR
jgi:V/A-type H+-transporting ATPase subunit I